MKLVVPERPLPAASLRFFASPDAIEIEDCIAFAIAFDMEPGPPAGTETPTGTPPTPTFTP